MKSILFSIHTEYLDRPMILHEASAFFPHGFTVIEGTGHYEGTTESTLVIEIYGTSEDRGAVHHLARIIKIRNKQESVLVTETKCKIEFI